MSQRPMPKIDLGKLKAGHTLRTHLTNEEYEIALLTLRVNKREGTARLRATKPNHTKSTGHGIAAVAWRLMVYLVSDRYDHMGFPNVSDFLSARPGSFARGLETRMATRIVDALLAVAATANYRCPSNWRRQFRTLGISGYAPPVA